MDRQRNRRALSREALAELTGLSAGTIKNLENTDHDVTGRTLDALDVALDWEPGTARAILVENVPAPPLPSTAPPPAGQALPRRLLAEYEGKEVLEVRALDVSGQDARIVLTLVGDSDMDIAAIRAALLELDKMERRLREEE